MLTVINKDEFLSSRLVLRINDHRSAAQGWRLLWPLRWTHHDRFLTQCPYSFVGGGTSSHQCPSNTENCECVSKTLYSKYTFLRLQLFPDSDSSCSVVGQAQQMGSDQGPSDYAPLPGQPAVELLPDFISLGKSWAFNCNLWILFKTRWCRSMLCSVT